jgi:hypothetical protein
MPTSIHGTNGITFNDGSTQNTRPAVGFRNRIINGDMRIDQRNAGASVTPTTDSAYTADRWCARLTQTSKFSIAQNAGSVTPPSGFTKYIGATSLSSFSVGAGDFFGIEQRIEGQNIDDLAWGTAGAKAVTLSFWVRSSLTGTFGGVFNNGGIVGAARSYPFSYTISSANTWEQKTVTVSGDTSGTWITTNGIGVQVIFALGVGTTYSTTAGSWTGGNASIGGFVSATGATSVVGTNGATFYLTGVQLEEGSTATEFERRPIGTELALCQRYFIRYINRAMGTMNGTSHLYNGSIAFPVTMRSTPTLVSGASFAVNTGSAGTPALDPTSTNNSAITTVDQAIFWNSSSNWTSNNFASITCSLASEL